MCDLVIDWRTVLTRPRLLTAGIGSRWPVTQKNIRLEKTDGRIYCACWAFKENQQRMNDCGLMFQYVNTTFNGHLMESLVMTFCTFSWCHISPEFPLHQQIPEWGLCSQNEADPSVEPCSFASAAFMFQSLCAVCGWLTYGKNVMGEGDNDGTAEEKQRGAMKKNPIYLCVGVCIDSQ